MEEGEQKKQYRYKCSSRAKKRNRKNKEESGRGPLSTGRAYSRSIMLHHGIAPRRRWTQRALHEVFQRKVGISENSAVSLPPNIPEDQEGRRFSPARLLTEPVKRGARREPVPRLEGRQTIVTPDAIPNCQRPGALVAEVIRRLQIAPAKLTEVRIRPPPGQKNIGSENPSPCEKPEEETGVRGGLRSVCWAPKSCSNSFHVLEAGAQINTKFEAGFL